MALKHVSNSDSREIGTLLKMIRAIPLSGSSASQTLSKIYLDFSINPYVHRNLTSVLQDEGVLDMVGSGSRYIYARIVSDVTTELCTRVYASLRRKTHQPLVSHPFRMTITPDVLSAEASVLLGMLGDMLSEYSPITNRWVLSKSFSKRCTSYGINSLASSYLPSYLLSAGVMVKSGVLLVPIKDVSISLVFTALSQFHAEAAFSEMTILTFKKLKSMLREDGSSDESPSVDSTEEPAASSMVVNVEPVIAKPEKRTAAWEVSILKAQEEQKKADAERSVAEAALCTRAQKKEKDMQESVLLDKLRHPDKYASLGAYTSQVHDLSRPCLAPGSEAWWFGEGMSLHYGIISSASLVPCDSGSGSEPGSLAPHYVVVTSAYPYEEVTVDCDVYSSRDELLDVLESKLYYLRDGGPKGRC